MDDLRQELAHSEAAYQERRFSLIQMEFCNCREALFKSAGYIASESLTLATNELVHAENALAVILRLFPQITDRHKRMQLAFEITSAKRGLAGLRIQAPARTQPQDNARIE